MSDVDSRRLWLTLTIYIPLLLLVGNLLTSKNILWTILILTWMGTLASVFYLYYAETD